MIPPRPLIYSQSPSHRRQLRELKNGRLAMLAAAGQIYTELLTGK